MPVDNNVDYETKLDYVLDNGLECKCCPLHRECDGNVKHTPAGPVLPACAEHGYEAVLLKEHVHDVYNEAVLKESKKHHD